MKPPTKADSVATSLTPSRRVAVLVVNHGPLSGSSSHVAGDDALLVGEAGNWL